MSEKSHAIRKIAADLRMRRGPCFICGQPIDYELPHGHPRAFQVEHVKPQSTHPHLIDDPANCVPAHAICNQSKGAREAPAKLGSTSRDW